MMEVEVPPMKPARLAVGLAVLFSLAAGAFAQQVISAQAGLVNHTLGKVLLNGAVVEAGGVRFPQMKPGDVLSTEEGRAEVLLDPGTFLRVGEESSFRLESASLTNWQLELEAGSFVLEVASQPRREGAAIRWKDFRFTPLKRGVYRIDLNPPSVRVFDGEALVAGGAGTLRLSKGRMLALDGAWAAVRFNREEDDALDRWSGRRAAYLAQANLEAAVTSGWRSRGLDMGLGGYWLLNPYLGMMTYVPLSGAYTSFYGYRFYSYQSAMELLYPPQPRAPNLMGGGGTSGAPNYPTNAPTPAGTSGTIAAGSPASTSAAGADSAPISRQSGDAGGRTR
jgi:hypothetical protein